MSTKYASENILTYKYWSTYMLFIHTLYSSELIIYDDLLVRDPV